MRDTAHILLRFLGLAAAVIVLNFVLPRLLPGDPLESASEMTGSGSVLTASTRAQLRAYYHLDDPPARHFHPYLADLAGGDLGRSISRSTPVADLVLDRLPWTLALVGSAALLSAAGGLALGLWIAGRTVRLARPAIGLVVA